MKIAELEDTIDELTTELNEFRAISQTEHALTKLTEELQQASQARVEDYRLECLSRKKYQNLVHDLKGQIRTFCRIRPAPTKHQTSSSAKLAVSIPDNYSVVLSKGDQSRVFPVDMVLGATANQDAVFQECTELIQSVIDGYNISILSYGALHTGRKHTCWGSDDDPGLATKIFIRLYQLLEDTEFRYVAAPFSFFFDN